MVVLLLGNLGADVRVCLVAHCLIFMLSFCARKLYFAFTASYSIPLISLTMEEHRLDPEAFWIHGCVFLALILETTH